MPTIFDQDLKKLVFGAFVYSLLFISSEAQVSEKPPNLNSTAAVSRSDGQHDFDFEIGEWKTHLRRRTKPLTGSDTWVEYQGTSVIRKIWNGRANLVELEVDGPAGHIEGLSLRLYDPEAGQWSLNFSNSAAGVLTPPSIGEFKNGRGEFFGLDTLNGRTILVRFLISCSSSDICKFEQAFSGDGAKTWEVNWIAVDTRVKSAGKSVIKGDQP